MFDMRGYCIAKSLQTSFHEIALVNCGIGDQGRRYILNSIKMLPQLKMICVE